VSKGELDDLSSFSMLELFRVEAESQTAILTAGLLDLEKNGAEALQLETLMRAAHSLKGAARIVNLPVAVKVAHAMEDCFVAAQKDVLKLGKPEIDELLRGVDLLLQISKRTEADVTAWEAEHAQELTAFLNGLGRLTQKRGATKAAVADAAKAPVTAS